MKKLLIYFLVLLNFAYGYVAIDRDKILVAKNGTHHIDIEALFSGIDYLWEFVRSYPLLFKSDEDRNLGYRDLMTIIKILDFIDKNRYGSFDSKMRDEFDFASAKAFVCAYNFDLAEFRSQADERFERVIKNNPNSGLYYRIYGEFLGNSNRNDIAKEKLKIAINLGENSAHFGLGTAYLMDGNFTSSRAEFEKYLEFYPDSEDAKLIIKSIDDGKIKLP